jgi:hypothetical protein
MFSNLIKSSWVELFNLKSLKYTKIISHSQFQVVHLQFQVSTRKKLNDPENGKYASKSKQIPHYIWSLHWNSLYACIIPLSSMEILMIMRTLGRIFFSSLIWITANPKWALTLSQFNENLKKSVLHNCNTFLIIMVSGRENKLHPPVIVLPNKSKK